MTPGSATVTGQRSFSTKHGWRSNSLTYLHAFVTSAQCIFATQSKTRIKNIKNATRCRDRYVGWNCVLKCLCYHPYLVPMLFADLLSLHLGTFYSCSCHFFLAACLSWSLPSITEQQVSPHMLPMQYWLKNHRLSSNTPRTPTVFLIQQSCVIITFRC